MTIKLTFLSANLPLTKTITLLSNGKIEKSPYPLVSNFTSEEVVIKTIEDFHEALLVRASNVKKPCLLKGNTRTPLVCESRKGSTETNSQTQWLCLDIDNAKFSTADEVMRAIGLDDISYITQYSSSYKLDGNKNLSCHIFLLLSKPLAAPQIKAWLMNLNQSVSALESNITLAKSGAALHWPLDITACQNDKLLYIAMPMFKNMKAPIDEKSRITLTKRKLPALPIERMELKPIDMLKKIAHDKRNQLLIAAGCSPLKTKVKMVGEFEVQTGVGEISNYEVFDCGEYNRLNLNGGDSQAYWHYKSDPSLLHNFKGEPSLPIKEILPHYYADLVRNARITDATPSTQGDLLLAFREKKTARYWKGIWNAEEHRLEIYTVDSVLQLDHFLQSHGRALGAFVPEWEIIFNPQNPVVVDEDRKIINILQATKYMRDGKKNKKNEFPLIQRVLDSAVGTGEVQEHFLNWLAVVWQQRRKPLTAWVLHGTEGTGKGLLFDEVIRPLFGTTHSIQKRASEMNSQFNGWLEPALIAVINEIDADMFINTRAVEADLKTMITDPTVNIRRMRTDAYEVPSYTAFLFYSNKKRPVAIPAGDRRFNVGVFQHTKMEITAEEVDAIADELEAFAHYLSTRPAVFELAKKILQTEDRRNVQRLSVTSVDVLAGDILNGNLIGLWEAMPDESLLESAGMVDVTAQAYAALVRRFSMPFKKSAILTESCKITRDELGLIFKHCVGTEVKGTHKLAAFLRHHGIELKKLRFGNQFTSGIEVNWIVNKDDLEAIRNELNDAPKLKAVK